MFKGITFEDALKEAAAQEGCTVWHLPSGGYCAATYTEAAEELPEDTVEVVEWEDELQDVYVDLWCISSRAFLECGTPTDAVLAETISKKSIRNLVREQANRYISDNPELSPRITNEVGSDHEYKIIVHLNDRRRRPIVFEANLCSFPLDEFTREERRMLLLGEWIEW